MRIATLLSGRNILGADGRCDGLRIAEVCGLSGMVEQRVDLHTAPHMAYTNAVLPEFYAAASAKTDSEPQQSDGAATKGGRRDLRDKEEIHVHVQVEVLGHRASMVDPCPVCLYLAAAFELLQSYLGQV